MILYLTEPGSRLRLAGGQLQIEKDKQLLKAIPRYTVKEVVLLGGTQVTSQAMRGLLEQGTPMHLLTQRGRYLGSLEPPASGKTDTLRAQVRQLDNPQICLVLAKTVVEAKLFNSRTVLLRLARKTKGQFKPAASTIEKLLDQSPSGN